MGMAPNLFKFPTILSLVVSFALLQQSHMVSSQESPVLSTQDSPMDDPITDPLDDQESPMDGQFLALNLRSGSRFLANMLKKGAKCDPVNKNICPGISINGGTGLLQCCKNNCRNVLIDRNNCGACGNKCGFGKLCCKGVCTDIAYNVNNCGKCGNKCTAGVKCEYGSCGYA